MLVAAVGENSQQGQSKKMMESTSDQKTPLQEKLADLADDIGKIGFRMAALTFGAMTVNLVVESLFFGGESLFTFKTF